MDIQWTRLAQDSGQHREEDRGAIFPHERILGPKCEFNVLIKTSANSGVNQSTNFLIFFEISKKITLNIMKLKENT